MKLPPLPESFRRMYSLEEKVAWEKQMREYAAAAYRAALEQAAQLVELEYAKDHQGVLRLKQIAAHVRKLGEQP